MERVNPGLFKNKSTMMERFSIRNFNVGDFVYHLSNPSFKMVVVSIDNKHNEITCRWMESSGKLREFGFYPDELMKFSGSTE
jgi:uncharacterized protein YodC (DUF2158 family)